MNINSGFTLIELILVIAIIGVMAGFIVIQFNNPRALAKDNQRKSDIAQYALLIEDYANRNNGRYPVVTGTSVPIQNLCNALGISKCYADPDYPSTHQWGHNYTSDASGTKYVLVAHLEKANEGGLQRPGHFFRCSSGKVIEERYDGPGGSPDPSNGGCP